MQCAHNDKHFLHKLYSCVQCMIVYDRHARVLVVIIVVQYQGVQ